MREITCVTMDITTHCDRRCPECCAGIGINRKLQHHPWEYFEAVAPFLQGIDRVNLTGGEPTLHPRFAEFVPRFKALFGCRRLTLSTDGFGVERYKDVIAAHIDEVHFSDYATRPTALVALQAMPGVLSVYPAGLDACNFTPRSQRGSGAACYRGSSDTVAYADGRFWPCCVAPGLDHADSLEPCMDWKAKILEIELGCRDCMFSV